VIGPNISTEGMIVAEVLMSSSGTVGAIVSVVPRNTGAAYIWGRRGGVQKIAPRGGLQRVKVLKW
jgi:hypothetical protein